MKNSHFNEVVTKHPMSIDDINNPNVEQASVVTPEKQKEPIKPNTKSTVATSPSSRPNRIGSNNPFFGHTHSTQSKQQQSQTQKARYAAMGKLSESGTLSLRQIIREEIARFISKNDTFSK